MSPSGDHDRPRTGRFRRATERVAIVACSMFASIVHAATLNVTSTASFTYQNDTASIVQTFVSNTTTIQYASRPPATPATVALMQVGTVSQSGASVAADGTLCENASGQFVPVPLVTTPNGAALNVSAVFLQRVTSLNAGDPIVIRVVDPGRNADSNTRETVDVRIVSSTGDEEVLRLKETGPDTGIFVGVISSTAGTSTPLDGRLSMTANGSISATYMDPANPSDNATSTMLVDPFGLVFDASTGTPTDGVPVTLVNAATGQPATVFGNDGMSTYPSTVVTGSVVVDGSGRSYPATPGGFRFPMIPAGDYQLRVVAPAGYLAPSSASPDALRALRPPDEAVAIGPPSFGATFTVQRNGQVQWDIPIDPVPREFVVQKTASVAEASAGDFVQYTVTVQNRGAVGSRVDVADRLPAGMRYRAGTLRVAGARGAEPVIAPDGRSMTIAGRAIAPGAQLVATYVAQVVAGAPLGDAVNDAWAIAGTRVVSNIAAATVRIKAPFFSDRFTIIGRVHGVATCGAEPEGVAGVRLMLDDGTYVVTDRDGLYHFEAVRPGTHVVALDPASLGEGAEPLPCNPNTRFAGRSASQFVEGDGGSLMRADFWLRRSKAAPTKQTETPRSTIASDAEAAGAQIDWLAGRARGIEWIFPAPDHNPRAPAVRIAIKHDVGQTVKLTNRGAPVDALALDGSRASADGAYAVSLWRGLPLVEGDNLFEADILDASGAKVAHLTRVVHYASAPAQFEFVPSESRLVADGIHKAVVAVRIRDRNGRPVHAGLIGPYRINAPYTPALELDLQQSRQLAGLDRNPTQYKVEGDDGIAHIELAPTTASGSVVLQFDVDRGLTGSAVRTQELRAWLGPANTDWIVVGFAKGTVGYEKLAAHAESLGGNSADGDHGVETHGQLSLYAKGQVLGSWLMTLAYDSGKPSSQTSTLPDRTSLLGVVDPKQFYTLYGDGTQQRADAASTSKLYLKLQRDQFYALFGDFETGMTETKLARYSRTLNGAKTEYRAASGTAGISVVAFASETAQGYGRDEMLGNGTSGLYRLSQSNILVNSETVRLETRDRFRSNVIVESRALSRGSDYDIDYAGGTLFFRDPVLAQDASLDPIFIVAEYETEGVGVRKLVAGGRAGIDWMQGRATTGISAIHDGNALGTRNLVGVDGRVKVTTADEVRLEAARTTGDRPLASSTVLPATTGNAWLVEFEHDDERVNALAYVRRQDPGFGLAQQNAIEVGTNKAGVDAQVVLTQDTKLVGQAYRLESLANGATRELASAQVASKFDAWTLRAGALVANDTATDGTRLESRQATLGATRAFLDNRLEVTAEANVSIGGKDDSTDYPSRYVLGASYALTERVKLLIAEEYASSGAVHALTTRAGLSLDPWKDAKLTGTINQSSISEYGPRTFAVLGLKQAWPITDHWTVDGSIDGNRTLRGTGPPPTTSGALVAPGANGDPSLSGSTAFGTTSLATSSSLSAPGGTYGALGTPASVALATLAENYTAATAGATYRAERWTWNARVENRDGQLATRRGVMSSFLRQADAGIAFAATAQVFDVAESSNGVRGLLARADLAWAYRPLDSRWAALEQLEFRRDQLTNATGGLDGALFGATTVQSTANARTTRLVNNLAFNGVGRRWGAEDVTGNLFDDQERHQWSIYYGAKYVFDRFDDADVRGFTDLIGIDARFDVTSTIDVGVRVNRLHTWSSHTTSYSAGPSIGFVPVANTWVAIGWNVRGFQDRDFGATDYTARGPYVTLRVKFDRETARQLASAFTQAKEAR